MEHMVHVELLNLQGSLARVSLNRASTTATLKEKVTELCHLPPSCQTLLVGGRVAGDQDLLMDLCTEPGAVLYVTVINIVHQLLQEGGRLEDKKAAVRYLATIASKNDASVLSTLTSRLEDRAAEVRQAAVEALAWVCSPAAPRLAELLQHSDASVRCAAAKALGPLGNDSRPFASDLADCLADCKKEVRWAALEALNKLEENAAPAAMRLAGLMACPRSEVRDAAASAIAKLGTSAEPAASILAELLGHEEWQVRKVAECALLGLGACATGAAPVLAEHLQHEDQRVRRKALRALSDLGQHAEPFLENIVKLLTDDKSEVRAATLVSLGKLSSEDATLRPVLLACALEMLSDSSGLVQHTAATTIEAQCGPCHWVKRYQQALQSLREKKWQIRLLAAKQLEELGSQLDPSTDLLLPELEVLIRDSCETVRHEAESVCERLQHARVGSSVCTKLPSSTVRDARSQARALLARKDAKVRSTKQRMLPVEVALEMLAGVPRTPSTAVGKIQRLQEIAELAIAPTRLSPLVVRCGAGHPCDQLQRLPDEYTADDCFAVDCDDCGTRDLQLRVNSTPFLHCRACSFDICASCGVNRACDELAAMLRREDDNNERGS